MLKRRGPRTEPCGTPETILLHELKLLFFDICYLDNCEEL